MKAALVRKTFADVGNARNNHTEGFDYLRLGLSLCVLGIHGLSMADPAMHRATWEGRFGPLLQAVLPAFFALSGYLVTGSLLRNTIPQFLTLRIMRIIPALAVEITITALIIGPVFTTLSLFEYISSPMFWKYFLNIIGIIQLKLPGVFEGRVLNGQLWTVPFELECYILLTLSSLAGLVRRRRLLLVVVTSTAFLMTIATFSLTSITPGYTVPGRVLVLSFLFGVLLFLFRDSVPFRFHIAALCFIVSYFGLMFTNFSFIAVAPLAYLTIFLGLQSFPKPPLADLSYGIFLFHYPVLRTLHEVAGERFGWLTLSLTGLAITGLAALASWHLVENPILRRKRWAQKRVDQWSNVVLRKRVRTENGDNAEVAKRLILSKGARGKSQEL